MRSGARGADGPEDRHRVRPNRAGRVQVRQRRRPLGLPQRHHEHDHRAGVHARRRRRRRRARSGAESRSSTDASLAHRRLRPGGYPRTVRKLLPLVVAAAALLSLAATASGAHARLDAVHRRDAHRLVQGDPEQRRRRQHRLPAAGPATRRAGHASSPGLPTVTLLDAAGHKLPTSQSFAGRPGMLTAVMVPLTPGTGPRRSPRASRPTSPARASPCRQAVRAHRLQAAVSPRRAAAPSSCRSRRRRRSASTAGCSSRPSSTAD